MTELQFCYWLQGYFELSGTKEVSPEQVKIIQEHLALVFRKVTVNTMPNYGLFNHTNISPDTSLKVTC
jgi:hypothetical protein